MARMMMAASQAKTPVLLRMLHRNVALSQWESFIDGADGAGFFAGGKNPSKTAQAIFTQLSHEKVVQLLVVEYDGLPEQVKLEFRDLCARGNASGNVRKNVQRLNDLLGGKLLRSQAFVAHVNTRVEGIDGAGYKRKAVNPAIAGATRKYGTR